ncbi:MULTISPECIES: hypothetical protein [unclassified Streptomyces]|uniref:hypothetical protein n=1 Tax=Streptomycetaceae TaxID=2062 RepID=UPI002E7829E9|nr:MULTISPECIES: hypothetical protein [unclassified Streptomyces]MED7954144.1 hypothetical protein [Streptomyces sp. BE303]MEE1825907.1 hypothetical protein [Streptomyces sp. BE20]
MPGLQRAVLLRAAAAALVLGAALGAQGVVGPALAKRGVERAERDAHVCAEAARVDAVVRAGRSVREGRRDLDAGRYDLGRPPGCDPNTR